MSSSIRRLDASTSRMIGAGQAITDVARVVKEGLENALDAGATKVVIRLIRFGLDCITIEDNGCGIPLLEPSDVVKQANSASPDVSRNSLLKTTLLESRSTTKFYHGLHGDEEMKERGQLGSSSRLPASPSAGSISSPNRCETIQDQEIQESLESNASSLQTLGFRGEALHALAQVSVVEIETMHENFQPYTCQCRYDPFEASQCVSRGAEYHTEVRLLRRGRSELGTTLIARDLFKILPVRRRDAETQRRAQLLQAVALTKQYAISHPWIQLCFTHQEMPPHGQTVTMVSLRGGPPPPTPHPSFWWDESMLSRSIADAYGGASLARLQSVSWVLNPAVPLTTTEMVLREAAKRHSQDGLSQEQKVDNTGIMTLHVRGFVWKLEAGGRATRDWQIWVVDGRLMDLPRWTKALDSAYRSCLPHASQSRHSAFFLHVWSDVPSGEEVDGGGLGGLGGVDGAPPPPPLSRALQYDVNLSPDKRQVLMVNEQACAEALHQTARQTFWSWSEGVQEMVSRSSALLNRKSHPQQKGSQATPWLSVVESTLVSSGVDPVLTTSSSSASPLSAPLLSSSLPGFPLGTPSPRSSRSDDANGTITGSSPGWTEETGNNPEGEEEFEAERRHMRLSLRMRTEEERRKAARLQESERKRLENAPISITSYVWRQGRRGSGEGMADPYKNDEETKNKNGIENFSSTSSSSTLLNASPKPLFSMKPPQLLLDDVEAPHSPERDSTGTPRETDACEITSDHLRLMTLIKAMSSETMGSDVDEEEKEKEEKREAEGSSTNMAGNRHPGPTSFSAAEDSRLLHDVPVTDAEEELMRVEIVYDDDAGGVGSPKPSAPLSSAISTAVRDQRSYDLMRDSASQATAESSEWADDDTPCLFPQYEMQWPSLQTLWGGLEEGRSPPSSVPGPSQGEEETETETETEMEGGRNHGGPYSRAPKRRRLTESEKDLQRSRTPSTSGGKKRRKTEDTASYLLEQDDRSLHELFTKTSFLEMSVHGQFNMGFIIGSVTVGGEETERRPPPAAAGPPSSTLSGSFSEVNGKKGDSGVEQQSVVSPVTSSHSQSQGRRVLIVVDQHASDEKANYERLLKDYVAKPQPLVVPVTLSLDAEEVRLALLHKDELQQRHGFQVGPVEHEVEVEEPLPIDGCECTNESNMESTCGHHKRRVRLAHPTQLKVYAIPLLPYDKVHPTDIAELLQHLQRYGTLSSSSSSTLRFNSETPADATAVTTAPDLQLKAVWHSLATKACRSSIMIGTVLQHAQMCQIVRRLSGLDHPWCCPHGRPTLRCLGELQTDWGVQMPSKRLEAFYQRCRERGSEETQGGRFEPKKAPPKRWKSTPRDTRQCQKSLTLRDPSDVSGGKQCTSEGGNVSKVENNVIMEDGRQNLAASRVFVNFHFDFRIMGWVGSD